MMVGGKFGPLTANDSIPLTTYRTVWLISACAYTLGGKQWVSVDLCILETFSKSADDFVDTFCEKLRVLLHSFIARQQSAFQAS